MYGCWLAHIMHKEMVALLQMTRAAERFRQFKIKAINNAPVSQKEWNGKPVKERHDNNNNFVISI